MAKKKTATKKKAPADPILAAKKKLRDAEAKALELQSRNAEEMREAEALVAARKGALVELYDKAREA